MDGIIQEMSSFDLAALTLAGVFSLALLVALVISWVNCRQCHEEKPSSHNRDGADFKRGV